MIGDGVTVGGPQRKRLAVSIWADWFIAFLLLVAAALAARQALFLHRSERTQGVVNGLQARQYDSESGETYAPIFRFLVNGRPVEVTSRSSSNHPAFGPGDVVSVVYDPATPSHAYIETWTQLWGLPIALSIGALSLVALRAFLRWVIRRREANPAYTSPTR